MQYHFLSPIVFNSAVLVIIVNVANVNIHFQCLASELELGQLLSKVWFHVVLNVKTVKLVVLSVDAFNDVHW